MAATKIIPYDVGPGIVRLFKANKSLFRMYIEFGNVENAGDPIVVPSLTRAGGIAYYQTLFDDPCNDFLRVGPVLSSDNTDVDLYLDDNRVQFWSQNVGTVGIHGKPFSHTAISKIIGGAVVVIDDPDDYTQDFVIMRFYYDQADQFVKQDGKDLSISTKYRID